MLTPGVRHIGPLLKDAHMKIRSAFVVGAILLAPAAALAQWSDNFDSYPTGTLLNGVGGWGGWDGSAAAAGTASNAQALSAPNSIAIGASADAVHSYDATEGAWTYTAHQYIPTAFTGTTYFILLNTYNDGGPYDWSVQLNFNGTTGLISDDNHPGSQVSFVRGQWAEIRFEIDLDADTVNGFYNNQLVSSGSWTSSASSATSIGAVDLFGNGAGTVYYDNMSLVPSPAAAALLGLGGLFAGRRRR